MAWLIFHWEIDDRTCVLRSRGIGHASAEKDRGKHKKWTTRTKGYQRIVSASSRLARGWDSYDMID
jgi:hypothetical protein